MTRRNGKVTIMGNCQMAGRVLRTWPGKNAALIFDFVPHDARDMRLSGDLLEGKPREQRKKEQKAAEEGAILDVFGIDREGRGIDGDPDEVIMRVLDYFSASHLAWTTDGMIATTSVSADYTLAILLPEEGFRTDPAVKAHLDEIDQVREDSLYAQAGRDRIYLSHVQRDRDTFRLFAVISERMKLPKIAV